MNASAVLAGLLLEEEVPVVRTELRIDSILFTGFGETEYDAGWAIIDWVPLLRVGRSAIRGLDVEIKSIRVWVDGPQGDLDIVYPDAGQDVPDDPREIVMTMGRPWRAEVSLSEPLPTAPYELVIDNDKQLLTVNF